MLTERLQILISPGQRARLDQEARHRDESVGQIVREAIDSKLELPSAENRHRALETLLSFQVQDISVAEMHRILDEEIQANIDLPFPPEGTGKQRRSDSA